MLHCRQLAKSIVPCGWDLWILRLSPPCYLWDRRTLDDPVSNFLAVMTPDGGAVLFKASPDAAIPTSLHWAPTALTAKREFSLPAWPFLS